MHCQSYLSLSQSGFRKRGLENGVASDFFRFFCFFLKMKRKKRRKRGKTEENRQKRNKSEATPFRRRPLLRNPDLVSQKERLENPGKPLAAHFWRNFFLGQGLISPMPLAKLFLGPRAHFPYASKVRNAKQPREKGFRTDTRRAPPY